MGDINDLINALAHLTQSQQQLIQALGQQQNVGNASTSTAKIAVQIPAFRGEPKENVVAWLLQVLTIFRAQGVNYATTGLKDAALHWYLNKVVGNNNVPLRITLGWRSQML